jgi:murein DD-endopeptidase MepM/ murein hydrolase activator NlpD
MVAAHGECTAAGCSLDAPAALGSILPGEATGDKVDLPVIGRAIQKVSQRFDHDAELCLEALYLGPENLQRALTQARLSGYEDAGDVEIHAGFLPPGERRGALQDALVVLVHFRLATLAWPLDPSLPTVSPYGERIHPVLRVRKFHNGIDIPARKGTPLKTIHHGSVHRASADSISGNYVKINHGLGIQSTYCHMNDVHVAGGQAVSRQEVVGTVGSTGRSTGAHLHFTLRISGKSVDPDLYRPSNNP